MVLNTIQGEWVQGVQSANLLGVRESHGGVRRNNQSHLFGLAVERVRPAPEMFRALPDRLPVSTGPRSPPLPEGLVANAERGFLRPS